MRIETWPIDRIKVEDRVRQELGNLSGLRKSMTERGLINPITVKEDGKLLAGERRLRAAQELGWQEIEVHVWRPADGVEFFSVEGEENIERKDLTPGEADLYHQRLKELLAPEMQARKEAGIQRAAEVRRGERPAHEGPRDRSQGTTRSRAAAETGYSEVSLERVQTVRKIAQDPEQPQEVQEVAEEQYTALMEGKAKPVTALRIVQDKIDELQKQQQQQEPGAIPTTVKGDRLPREQRVAQIRHLIEQNMTSEQMSSETGMAAERIRRLARDEGFEIPGDKALRGMQNKSPESNRIVEKTVQILDSLTPGLEIIDYKALNREEIPFWIQTMSGALKPINTLLRELKGIVKNG